MKRAAAAAALVLVAAAVSSSPHKITEKTKPAVRGSTPSRTYERIEPRSPASRDWIRTPLDLPPAPPTPQPSVVKLQPGVAPPPEPHKVPVGQASPPSPSARLSSSVATKSPVAVGTEPPAATGLDGNQRYALGLVGATQFACLLPLWHHESGWRKEAHNSTSTAAGIAELLTEKSNDAFTQIRDGLAYIKSRYGTPCAAWAFWRAQRPTGWY